MTGGLTMGPPIPTMSELLKFAEKALAQRKQAAEKLLEDSAITRDQLIKLGLLSDKDMS